MMYFTAAAADTDSIDDSVSIIIIIIITFVNYRPDQQQEKY